MAAPAWAQAKKEQKVDKFNVRVALAVAAELTYATGPAFSPARSLVVSDSVGNCVYVLKSEGKVKLLDGVSGPAGNAFDNEDRLYTCESRGRRVIRTDVKGKREVIAESFEGKRFNGPNDLVVTRRGVVYFTDPAFGYQRDRRELPHYGIYRVASNKPPSLVAKRATRPNGIAISPDEKTIYISDVDERSIVAYTVGPEGTLVDERTLISAVEGTPNSLAVDKDGNIYVPTDRIFIYSPAGKEVDVYTTPEGANGITVADLELRTMFVTARTRVFKIQMGSKEEERKPNGA